MAKSRSFQPQEILGGSRRAGLALLTALLLAGCGPSPEAMVESAKSYLAKKDLNAASIQLKNALQESGNLAEARFLLGKVNLQQGNVAGAVKELQRAAELGYDENEVAPLLARALVLSGQFDSVLNDYSGKTLSTPAAQVALATAVGTAYLGKADLASARKAYEKALAISPDAVEARVGLGRTALFSGSPADAQAEAEAAIARQPGAGDAHSLRADALLAQNNPDEAVKSLEAAVQARPDNVAYHFELISLLLRMGKMDDATARLEAMKKVAANHPSTRYLQAFIDYRNNRVTEARDGVTAALKNAPDFLPAHLLAGSVFMRLNEHEQARTHLNKVLERAPSQVLARRLLVASYLASGQQLRALEALEPLQAQLNAPGADGGLLQLAGQVYLANGEADKAEAYFARMVAAEPQSAEARTRLALARLAGGDTERAFADLEAASDLDATSGRADLALVLAHMGRREFDKALAAQAELEKKQPNSPQTYNLKGGILLGLKDAPRARAAFEKALEVQPDFLPAVANLARLDLADKRPDTAKARFEGVIQRNPKQVDALLGLAELQRALGEPAPNVLATLERAVAADPTAVPAQLALIRHQLQHREASKALASAQKLASAQPNNPAVIEALGQAQMAAGEQQQGIATFNKLVTLQPQAAVPLLLLADAQRTAKDTTGAEQSLRKALAIKADLLDAQQRLAALLVQRGASAEALVLAKTIQKQRGDAAVGYVIEGEIHSAGSKWPEAVAAYRQAVAHGKSGDSVRRLHGALVRAGKRQEADKLLADWLRAEPKDMAMLGYAAELALAEKRHGDALKHYLVMHEVSPKNPLVLNNLAWTAGYLKDPQAMKYAEEALALAPDNAVVLDTAGMIQIANGQAEKGLANLVRAVGLAPELTSLRFNLAKAYVELGRKDDARKELDVLMPKLQQGSPLHSEATTLLKSL